MVSHTYQTHLSLWQRLNQIDTNALSPTSAYGFIPGLDGLRALSVLIVLVAHMGLDHIVPGGFGVTVFFFISGFLITRLLIAEQEAKGRVNLPMFYMRRFARLYPALLFMVFGTTLISGLMGYGLPTKTEFLAAVFYFTNFYQVHAASVDYSPLMSWTPLWSLAVEEHFYLLFPLLVLAAGLVWKRLHMAVLAIIVMVPLWRMFVYFNLNVPVSDYNYMMTDARIDSIAWGCLLTIMLHRKGIEGLRLITGVLPVLVAGAALLASFIIRDDSFRYIFRFSLQGAAICVLILNLYYLAKLRWAFKVLELAPLVWIGKTSYALYLWHYPVYDFVHRNMDVDAWSIALTLVISFVMTAISFYMVEGPFMKLRKRFGSHIPVRKAAPSASG
ncbi:acyltransferase family protein [Fretibacter rubidus]|uniref:acyltransferase family protein n=1 Tax=Fretibacter rubidus TaxID=570162 RepID=UPI00352A1D24